MVIVLPTTLLLAHLIMGLFGCLPPDAHVRALIVVEPDDTFQDDLTFGPGGDGHLVEPFALEDAVGALGYGIFQRIPALGHTNADSVLPQLRHVRITTVLTPPV